MTLITDKLEKSKKKDKLSYAQKLMRKEIGKAIKDYGLIEPGDKICIGVSGGQDSLSLVHMLSLRMLREALKYSVVALYVKTDYNPDTKEDIKRIQKQVEGYGVKFYKRKAQVVKTNKKKCIDCFWCSWNKRKKIFSTAKELECNKIALGHHKDDIIETMLMNLFYNGIVSTINPKQSLFKGELQIIRPFVYLEKADIEAFSKIAGIRADMPKCPNSDTSKREVVNKILKEVTKDNNAIKINIFRAPSRIKEEYLGEPLK